MDTNNLVHMANRIADFFDAMPDRAEALDGVAHHIRRYWEPRMRRLLLAAADAGTLGDARPLLLETLGQRRALIEG